MPAPVEILRGVAQDRKINWDKTHGAHFRAKLWRLNGKRIQVTVEEERKPRKPRSKEQRGYYFAVIVKMISEETGQSEADVHNFLKLEFLRIYDDSPVPHARSTEDLSTAEGEEYHDKCRGWALDFLGLVVPLPNECEGMWNE